MAVLKIILTVIFIIISIALTVIILMQEGKSAGLGTISGMADDLLGGRTKAVLWRRAGEVNEVPGDSVYCTRQQC